MMYIVSDNAYFSRGFYESLEGSKEGIECLTFPFEVNLAKKFRNDDFILLFVEELCLLDRFTFLLPKNIVTVIFIGIPSFHFFEKLMPYRQSDESISLIDTSSIPSILKRIFSNNQSRYNYYSLTDRERIIMDFLARGVSVRRVSSIMNIDVDIISACKNSSLRKLGLKGMNARALFIYKIIAMTKKVAVCIYEPIEKIKS
ncbi:hypothetical protein [Rouxiella sp. Mn2063]|uniref:hypothetical protein n=1 Tax=Rouxiella sp. Mn2063 TaxID=3395262 RepID=UPI003BCEBC70